MYKVLITGGTGFVGAWMQKTTPENTRAVFIGKQGYANLVEAGFPLDVDYIVHLANIPPTEVIDLAIRNHARLLYCSSGAAYDQHTEYAGNKRKWEQECLNSGANVVIARLFTFFGRGLDDGKAYTQFMRSARAGLPLQIWGDGSTVRAYQHGREAAKWMWAILLHGKSGETYDVGSDRPTTILQLAQRIARGCTINIHGGKDAVPYYVPRDTAKTKALFDDNHSSL